VSAAAIPTLSEQILLSLLIGGGPAAQERNLTPDAAWLEQWGEIWTGQSEEGKPEEAKPEEGAAGSDEDGRSAMHGPEQLMPGFVPISQPTPWESPGQTRWSTWASDLLEHPAALGQGSRWASSPRIAACVVAGANAAANVAANANALADPNASLFSRAEPGSGFPGIPRHRFASGAAANGTAFAIELRPKALTETPSPLPAASVASEHGEAPAGCGGLSTPRRLGAAEAATATSLTAVSAPPGAGQRFEGRRLLADDAAGGTKGQGARDLRQSDPADAGESTFDDGADARAREGSPRLSAASAHTGSASLEAFGHEASGYEAGRVAPHSTASARGAEPPAAAPDSLRPAGPEPSGRSPEAAARAAAMERTVELRAEASASRPVQSLRLAAGSAGAGVELRVSQARGGLDVQVEVRAAGAPVREVLRTNLQELLQSLDGLGYDAEMAASSKAARMADAQPGGSLLARGSENLHRFAAADGRSGGGSDEPARESGHKQRHNRRRQEKTFAATSITKGARR
jgi:hypothetical protein